MKKLITLAIASALVFPSAFAAEDELGMRFTSASEGLYASIRTQWSSGSSVDDTGSFGDTSSRFGIQGSTDIGGGLEGFYNYEAAVGENNGDPLTTRLRLVGLRGAFGDIRFGTFWDDTYNFVTSKSDMSPNDSGWFAPTFRINNAAQWVSPDLNGFQAGIRIQAINGGNVDTKVLTPVFTAEVTPAGNVQTGPNIGDPMPTTEVMTPIAGSTSVADSTSREDNQIDSYALVGQYSIAGFNIAGTYERAIDGFTQNVVEAEASVDGVITIPVTDTTSTLLTAAISGIRFGTENLPAEDKDFWAVGMSYAQDNWYVGGWYGETDQRVVYDATGTLSVTESIDAPTFNGDITIDKFEDVSREALETLSLGGNVTVDKVVVFGVWEGTSNNIASNGNTYDNTRANVGVLYNLGSQSNVWVEYVARNNDNNPDADDYVNLGMRHTF